VDSLRESLPILEIVATVTWVLFILDFLLRLWLSPDVRVRHGAGGPPSDATA
jgi:hypothetical protein